MYHLIPFRLLKLCKNVWDLTFHQYYVTHMYIMLHFIVILWIEFCDSIIVYITIIIVALVLTCWWTLF